MKLLVVIVAAGLLFGIPTKAENNISVEKITLSETSLNLKVGNKTTISALIRPVTALDNGLKWKSNNSKVATVNNKGTIKAKHYGSALITVYDKKTGVSAKCKVKVTNKYTNADLRLVSAIVYHEAGNQCYAGKKAVAIVVMNRVRSSRFPNSVPKVLFQRGQFTPAGSRSFQRSLYNYDKGKMNSSCIKAARSALEGSTTVTYNGRVIEMKSFHFFAQHQSHPRLIIQGHQFK